ncbi:Sucrose nonfermenting 4-like protein [Camellia lanceoleosa]|uniref:Sucrose nonfermenting 4-like protein n=1 Tax=Camellia lanceoleosa TaxID=1840588 RepID=A0ACC0GRE8_9ERIC|nr:Sucrose nonfermenting 4-like protein [Camellia lanceoleosa]
MKKLLPSFPAEGKMKDSFAVVMESVDPYEDFKASMIEMILAKQLFEERDFEQLLECFLSLNSRHHYGYKIVVDGKWRHDEHQPFENGNYGTVNTVFLARESDYVPGILNPQMHSGSNMDVDNEAFQFRVSGGPLHEASPRVSEADLEVSCHRIMIFLSTHMAYELLPESSKVIALDVDLPVKQAFHILHEQGINMAPLWDFCKGQFVGVLSALDFIMIIRELGSHGSNLIEEELETHTISAWKDAKSYLSRQIDGKGRLFPRQLVRAGPDENLKDVALKILQNNFPLLIKKKTVPVIHSSSGDASILQLLHLASLSGIPKCICRYFKHSSGTLPMLQLPICAIPLGTWVPGIGEANRRPLAMLRPRSSLGLAWSLLVQAQVSSIPIVDDNDSLLNVYSRSDITALAKDKIYTHINLEEMTINQALQLGQEPYSPYGSNNQRRHMCLRSDPLHKVMEQLANPGVRRLIVVEAGSKRVEGIITIGDIFRFLVG